MAKYPKRDFLPDRLELLMRLGLVDRSKLQQYKLAFKNPDANVRYQHYRSKILEVFYRVFEIVATNDPIFIKVRQEVIRRYRNQKPMKKKPLKEAAKKDGRLMGKGDKSKLTSLKAELHKKIELGHHDHVIDLHNKVSTSPRPAGMKHQTWIARRAVVAAAATKAKAAKKQAEFDHIDKIGREAVAQVKKEMGEPTIIPIHKLDAMMKKHKAEQAEKAKREALSKARSSISVSNPPSEPEKKKSLLSRMMSRLGKKSVSEGLSMSGGRAHLQSKSSGERAVNKDRSELMANKNKAQSNQNQSDSSRNRTLSALGQMNKNSRGRPVT
jgi:hypothetical protein